MSWWQRVLPPTKLERDLVWQCVLSAFATGTFLTGTAVYFTRIVGLSGAEVGLGMSIAAVVTLVLQLPMGRLADRVGAKPLWALASAVEAASRNVIASWISKSSVTRPSSTPRSYSIGTSSRNRWSWLRRS